MSKLFIVSEVDSFKKTASRAAASHQVSVAFNLVESVPRFYADINGFTWAEHRVTRLGYF
jgi:hypothetical protein